MALSSSMMPLGTKAPNFSLYDVISNKIYQLKNDKPNISIIDISDFPRNETRRTRADAVYALVHEEAESTAQKSIWENVRCLVIMFICNHCPYVKHLQQGLIQIANDYQAKGILFIAINSNDENTYPDDSPENMKKVAQEFKYPFPYLFDETQNVARTYQAVCTPDFFLFNKELECVYRGQFDDSRPSNSIPVTGSSLRLALDSLLAGREIDQNQKASIGCGIKWKKD